MKFLSLLVLPFVALTFSTATFASEKEEVEIKSKSDGKDSEYKMKVKRKGNDYVGFVGEREYVLHGEPITTLKTEGDYTVYGTLSSDGRVIETRRIEPVIVTKDRPVEYKEKVEVKDRPVEYKEKIEIKKD